MKYKIFISTAGKGTRMAGLDAINKSLLPINYEAVISKIIDKFPKNIEIVIAVGHEKEVVKNFIKIRHFDRKIKFVFIKKYFGIGSGPGYTVYKCRKYLQCPFIYSACDTIVPENIPAPKFNWIGTSKVNSTERYLIIDKKKSDKSYILFDKKRKIEIDEKKRVFNAFIGLAGIKDYKKFWKGFEENKRLIHNELQFSNGLNYILSNTKLKNFNYLDTGTNESYIKTLDYFKDNVLRKPNACTYIGNGKVIKFFKDKSKPIKLKNRSKYLRSFSPKNTKIKPNYFYYDYADGSMLSEMKLKNFKFLIDQIDKKFWKIQKKFNKRNFHSLCYDFYKNKTLKRISLLFAQKIVNDDIKYINGYKTLKINEILNKINWKKISNGIPSNFHGDFQPENIILNKNKITLIDWREDFSGNEKIGDVYYDLAKLDHALVINGDIIRNKKYSVKITKGKIYYKFSQKKNLKTFRKYFHQYIKNRKYDLDKIKILSSLIYLNIAPLHEYPYNEFLFYHGKLNLMKLLKKK
tara:strand:+ start:1711 stop:3273 length:1563 start_codon:yes stop_codon:yes gene_type:complete